VITLAFSSRGDGGAGDPQLPGQHGHALAGIDLQGRDQLAVDFVENGWANVRQRGCLQRYGSMAKHVTGTSGAALVADI
jgi:hypothetical protein